METNKKKLYKKPELQEVKLVPEEAVLANCKCTSISANSCTNASGGTIGSKREIGS